MAAAAVAFLTWAAVAASAVFWGLRLFVPGASTPEAAIAASRAPGLASADLGRVLGGGAAAPGAGRAAPAGVPADTRFKLLGIVALQDGAAPPGGLALLSVDGKPARSYRVGSVVDGDWIVQQLDARAVSLGPPGGAPMLTLSLPPLPAAARNGPAAAAVPVPAPGPAPGGVAPPGTGVAPGAATSAAQETPGEGRVPSPEPGSLRRPGPVNR